MRTIQRALSVFECFDSGHTSLSLQEIARQLGLAKSTTFRLVQALEKSGYLTRLDNLRYSLSFKFVRLAALAHSAVDIRTLVRPVLEKLAAESRECVTFHTVEGDARFCVDVVNTPSPLMAVSRSGERLPLGLGAASLVLMAHMPEPELERVLPHAARNARCDKRELRSILKTVRRQGYAVSHGGVPGVSGISAPVPDAENQVRYCVSIVIPTVRVRGKVAAMTTLVRRGAAELSKRLGG